MSRSLRGFATLVALLIGAAACDDSLQLGEREPTDEDLEVTYLRRCSAKRKSASELGEARSELNVLLPYLWTSPKIPVCWEADPLANVQTTERGWVRDAVERGWHAAFNVPEVAPEARVEFVGWGTCDEIGTDGVPTGMTGIRISVQDRSSQVRYLGNAISGMSKGMRLNFTFQNHKPICAENEAYREACIRSVAVHEFGHALGFAHEHNRKDTPASCTDSPQGTEGDFYLGEWDEGSIMDYCHPEEAWTGKRTMSLGDVTGARAAYYPWLYDIECVELDPETGEGLE